MKIGFVSSWNTVCGVANYGQFLVNALRDKGHQVKIFAQNDDCEEIIEKENVRCFRTGQWLNKNKECLPAMYAKEEYFFDLDLFLDNSEDCDIFHLNYQDFLYPGKEGLYRAIANTIDKGKKWFVSFHDNCIHQYFPFDSMTKIFVHTQEFAKMLNKKNILVIPHGIYVYPEKFTPLWNPKIDPNHIFASFGLGRNNYREVFQVLKELKEQKYDDLFYIIHCPIPANVVEIRKIVEEIEFDKNSYYIYEKFYNNVNVLITLLRFAKIIIFNYPESYNYTTSSAIRLAISADRNIVCNNNNWFRDLDIGVVKFKSSDLESMKDKIIYCIEQDTEDSLRIEREILMQKYSWDNIAELYISAYS